MKITVNGKDTEIRKNISVKQLLDELGLDLQKVAIERNLEIIPRSLYAATQLQVGDSVEIVHFIGGGCSKL